MTKVLSSIVLGVMVVAICGVLVSGSADASSNTINKKIVAKVTYTRYKNDNLQSKIPLVGDNIQTYSYTGKIRYYNKKGTIAREIQYKEGKRVQEIEHTYKHDKQKNLKERTTKVKSYNVQKVRHHLYYTPLWFMYKDRYITKEVVKEHKYSEKI